MKSHPYLGIDENVKRVVSDVLDGADEYHVVHKARLARTADLLYKEAPSGKLLEVGTSGFFPLVCKDLFPDLEVHATHFDTSNPSPSDVKVSVGDKSINVCCFNHDLEFGTFPVPDETYDFILCCEVLEHMEIDPMFMLSELNRVMKTGGTLILTTPNITSSRALAKILFGLEPYFYMSYHKNRQYNRHNFEYSSITLHRVLSAAGFDITVWSEDLFEDGMPALVNNLRAQGYRLGETGDNLIAVGDKVSGVTDRYPVGLYV